MQEQKPRAGGQLSPCGQLSAAARGGGFKPRADVIGQRLYPVFRAAIDDDQLSHQPGIQPLGQCGQRGAKGGCGI